MRLRLLWWGILAFLLFSCSPKWHINRAIKKDPSILKVDTLVVRDTIRTYTERVEVDSVFMVSNDTVTIIKDNLRIRHFIHNDSVFIDGECDSIFVEVPYEVEVIDEKLVYKESWFPKWMWWIIIGVVVFIVYDKFFRNNSGTTIVNNIPKDKVGE